jgi:hypothetical protein
MQIFIIAFIFLSLTVVDCNKELPESKVPSLVQNAFRTKFTDAKDIDWEKSGRLYVVEFEIGTADEDHTVLYDTLGTVVMYKYEIATSGLPSPVMNVINTQHQGYEISEVENLEQGGVNYYQVELEKGIKKQHFVFSADGILNNKIKYWD